jgi:CRISPR/Cas system-associated exonuclease Cas4 (RecB family)
MSAKRITRWSYSLWKTYGTCPRKVKYNKIDGIREPASPAMERGTAIHLEGEDYLNHKVKTVPKSYEKFTAEMQRLRKAKAVAEEEFAFDMAWNRVPYDSREAWVRAKLDVRVKLGRKHMLVVDFKTGKVYEENRKQLSFYALLVLLVHPEVDVVDTALWYLDQGPEHNQTDRYERHELEDMKAAWTQAPAHLLHDTVFAPRPGFACRWCFYSKSNGGPCEF